MGLAWTFAHELQHFVQHVTAPEQWNAGRLIRNDIAYAGLGWCDIPSEREARIVAKRVSEALFGAEAVRLFIEAKISQCGGNKDDAADWECVRGLDTSLQYDLATETTLFFQRHPL